MRVVVIVARRLPAGWVGGYGNEWVVTPNLDALTAAGVTFDRHYAAGPDAYAEWKPSGLPATLIRVGRPENDPPADGFASVIDARQLPDDTTPADALLRVIPPAGDSSLLWIDMDRLIPPWAVPAELFDAYIGHLLEDADPDEEPPAAVTEPFAPADDDERELLHTSFATAVTALDVDLGRTFDRLRETGWDDAVWILTSDLGFPLGEHDEVESVHVEGVHIPLVVRLPDSREAGRRVSALTQPADLVPTLHALFGRPTTGFDLRPLWDGSTESIRDAAITVIDGVAAIRTADWALVGGKLFGRPDDRWEATDLRSRNIDVAEELEARLPRPDGPSPPA